MLPTQLLNMKASLKNLFTLSKLFSVNTITHLRYPWLNAYPSSGSRLFLPNGCQRKTLAALIMTFQNYSSPFYHSTYLMNDRQTASPMPINVIRHTVREIIKENTPFLSSLDLTSAMWKVIPARLYMTLITYTLTFISSVYGAHNR